MKDNEIVKWIMGTDLRRWLLFMPLALISAALSGVIWEILCGISMNRCGIYRGDFMYNIWNMPLSGIISGFILTYVGGYIAPHQYVKTLLLSLVTIMSVLIIFGNLFMFKSADYWICLYNVFLIIGALSGRNYINVDEKK